MLPMEVYYRLRNKKIVIYDIDNTIIDVRERYNRSLEEAGLDPNTNIRIIPPHQRNRFWRVFLSSKYIDLDKPDLEEIERLNSMYEMGYGIVLITGRPNYMRRDTEKQLSQFGVKYHALIMRPDNNREPDKIYKLKVIKEMVDLGLEIIEYHEDDPATIDRVKKEFPWIEVCRHNLMRKKMIFHDED